MIFKAHETTSIHPGFAIPPLATTRHPAVVLAPRELRRWADELPMGNPPQAAKILAQQLQLLVRDPDPGAKLPALLEAYDAPALRLLEVAEDRIRTNTDFAAPLDQLEYALLDLLVEQSYGQLRVANMALESGKQPETSVLWEAMRLLDTARNIERLHYCRNDDQTWRLILAIYQYADQHAIIAQPVSDVARAPSVPASLEGLFYRALVISLCDPNHHRPVDILRWYEWTGRHTDKLTLAILPQGAFSIPIDISGEMSPLAGARRGKPGPEMRYLMAEHFMAQLREDPDAPSGLYDTLSDLSKGRKKPEQRESPRQPRRHPFRLFHGLRPVHARLNELIGGEADAFAAAPVDCIQVNQSRGGAAFELSVAPQSPLGIGDVILAEADNPNPGGAPVGFVGRVQRLVNAEDGSIEIGIEKLGGRLVPSILAGSAAERAHGNKHALLQESADGRLTLLATSSVFREGDSIVAEGASARFDLRMRGVTAPSSRIAYIDVELSG